jgi:hypothetical protein
MHFRIDRVLEDAARQIFGQQRSPDQEGYHAHAYRVLTRVQQLLAGPWRAAQSTQLPCAVHFRRGDGVLLRCTDPMTGACSVCRRPACLSHALVGLEKGELICLGCVEIARQHLGAPPDARGSGTGEGFERLKRKHMRRLHLTDEPTEADILSAFKREAAKAHPDKQPDERKRQAHKRFVLLGESRDWLLDHLHRSAA